MSYTELTENDRAVYNQYGNDIYEAVAAVFGPLPADFQLNPVSVKTLEGCGTNYNFKVALPSGQYANVSFHKGGFMQTRRPDQPPSSPKKPSFHVDPTSSSSAYE